MAKNFQLNLYDPVPDQTYELLLSEEDFQRAQTDMNFVQSLLFHGSVTQPSNQQKTWETVTETSINCDENHTSAEIRFTKHVWTYEEIVGLINSMENHIDDLNHPKKRKHVFEKISNDLLSICHSIPPEICQSKWKSLLRSYKSAKDNKNKTGRGAKRFIFFDLVDNIVGNKPSNSCTHTLEFSDLNSVNIEAIETINKNADSDHNSESIESNTHQSSDEDDITRKRRFGSKDIYDLKKAEYIIKQKRHEEKMDIQKKKCELLQNLLDKL